MRPPTCGSAFTPAATSATGSFGASRPSVIQAWLRKLQQELALFNAAVDDGLITTNPCRAGSVKLPKREQRKIEPWPIEQVEAVLAALPDRYRAVGLIAGGCGLRQGEVCSGCGSGTSTSSGASSTSSSRSKLLDGRVLLTPKGGKTRTVPLPDAAGAGAGAELAEHLRRWPAEGDDLMFTSPEGKPINRTHFNPYTWKPALQAAGVPPTRTQRE